jgi:hypothetical protein
LRISDAARNINKDYPELLKAVEPKQIPIAKVAMR